LVTVLHRNVVRSAADASHQNKRASFKSDVQESLKLLGTKTILSLFGKIVIIRINQEIPIMMCQTGLVLRQTTQTSILTIELGLT
jgi:hypothetical protein